MKSLIPIALLILVNTGTADEIKKWTDAEGRVHYGDKKAVIEDPAKVETLDIEDTFDQQSYDDAMKRNRETEESLDQYRQEREDQARRELEEAAANRPVAPPPSGGTTIVYPPAVYTGPGRPIRPGPGVGRPTPTPLPSRPINRK